MIHHKMPPLLPRYPSNNLKMMAIIHWLQQIMINENMTGDDRGGCAEIVRDNAGWVSELCCGLFFPARGPKIPPYQSPPRCR